MSIESDIAMSVVKYAVEGTIYTTKIFGKGVGTMASKITKALNNNRDSLGKTALKDLIKRGKNLEVMSIRKKYVKPFSKIAKKYGIRFCVIKDKSINDGMIDILVDQDEKRLVNRIIERYGFELDKSIERAEMNNGVSESFLQKQENENPLDNLLTNNENFEIDRKFSIKEALDYLKNMFVKTRTKERSDTEIER